ENPPHGPSAAAQRRGADRAGESGGGGTHARRAVPLIGGPVARRLTASLVRLRPGPCGSLRRELSVRRPRGSRGGAGAGRTGVAASLRHVLPEHRRECAVASYACRADEIPREVLPGPCTLGAGGPRSLRGPDTVSVRGVTGERGA